MSPFAGRFSLEAPVLSVLNLRGAAFPRRSLAQRSRVPQLPVLRGLNTLTLSISPTNLLGYGGTSAAWRAGQFDLGWRRPGLGRPELVWRRAQPSRVMAALVRHPGRQTRQAAAIQTAVLTVVGRVRRRPSKSTRTCENSPGDFIPFRVTLSWPFGHLHTYLAAFMFWAAVQLAKSDGGRIWRSVR
jgi:hypothetical protein